MIFNFWDFSKDTDGVLIGCGVDLGIFSYKFTIK